jgi:ATP-dependent Lhr-like helicase
VYDAVDQLAGAAVPASVLETLVLPTRVAGYQPAALDELTAAGDVIWAGAGGLPGGDGWVVLAPASSAPLLLPAPGDISMTPLHEAILSALDGGGGMFFRMLSDRAVSLLPEPERPGGGDGAVAAALWDLVWAGRISNDTLAPLRTVLGSGRPAAPAPAGGLRMAGRPGRHGARRHGYGRPAMPTRTGPPTVSGRWSLVLPGDADPTRRLHALARTLLDRHGILTRGAVATERVPGGFAALYPVLRAMEDAGQCRRGYFVEGLGAAQFALPGAVDRMRAMAADADVPAVREPPDPWVTVTGAAAPGAAVPGASGDNDAPHSVLVLAAADPANPYGAALPWPDRPDETPGGHRPGRKAGALVVLADGRLVLYVERGGRTLLSWTSDPVVLSPAAAALAEAVRGGALGRLTVERADGAAVHDSPLAQALESAGFRPTPRGLRLRG